MSTMELKVPATGATVNLQTKERLAVYASNLREKWEAERNQTKLRWDAKLKKMFRRQFTSN